MARVLVVGGAGLLGQHVRAEAARRGHEVLATHHGPPPGEASGTWFRLDLRELDALPRVLADAAPDLVVNAAALTDVDGCEDRPEEARKVNALAPALLAKTTRTLGGAFVHASTDYVFDGSCPATEETPPRPLSVYGATKLEGERLVREAFPGALVLRLSAVFGWNRLSRRANAVTWILGKFEAGEEVPLFADQRLTPTYAKTAAEVALDLWDLGAHGLFHVACRECLSRVEMGRAIAEVFAIPHPRILPVSLADAARKARRPATPCLVVRKVEETLKRDMPGFRACLEDMRATR